MLAFREMCDPGSLKRSNFWGCGHLWLLQLFSYSRTDTKVMHRIVLGEPDKCCSLISKVWNGTEKDWEERKGGRERKGSKKSEGLLGAAVFY